MDRFLQRMLDTFGLTDEQRDAASERACNLAVTAGAGSGKTRTLVARYLGLLSEGLEPRRVVAITFTEKAAREMRSRARQELRKLAMNASDAAQRQQWLDLDAAMDSARIGTIHSLCAEILRSHPAEAQLDPRFSVIDENRMAALHALAVENALNQAVQQPHMAELFRSFSLGALDRLLKSLLDKRLEISPSAFDPAELSSRVVRALQIFLEDTGTLAIRRDLEAAHNAGSLAADAGDKVADQVLELLANLNAAATALAQNDALAAARTLFHTRRSCMRLNIGKKVSSIKDAVQALRDLYDAHLNPWLGGAKTGEAEPSPQVEAAMLTSLPLLAELFTATLGFYRAALDQQHSLDFDDLEAGAVALLRLAPLRNRWQHEVAALLVDEFQDTNSRQREIILALSGDQPGRLFVVGDARQSIYRFRGADVTVFTDLQAQIIQQGGRIIDLDRTFRAHPDLLEATGALLQPIMGDKPNPLRPSHIPYTRLNAGRRGKPSYVAAPFIECILAAAQSSEEARPSAARALAHRLIELKTEGQVRAWDEVALLFRATGTFPVYEQALEEAGIPFVTVAGSGFYNRPEVRDLLNMLRALANPWDDHALAGLLRSPAFGLSDVGLYQLRCTAGEKRSLRNALSGDLSHLPTSDGEHARRALAVIDDLEAWVDRLPVANLLQRLVNHIDYYATLASCSHLPGSTRLWRNVDKLISDAQSSGIVGVRAFLEYITTLRDVGAREGEAASEAEGSLRLMTIHKSKGLEFPLVVLADASRQSNPGRDSAYRLDQAWAIQPDKFEAPPLAFRLGHWYDMLQSEDENQRLLYVALTRARDKLIISGHLSLRGGSLNAHGWTADLLAASGILSNSLLDQPGLWQNFTLIGGSTLALWFAPLPPEPVEKEPADNKPDDLPPIWPESSAIPLYTLAPEPIESPPVESLNNEATIPGEVEAYEPLHFLTPLRPTSPPARIVGELVHKALQRWRFPGDPLLAPLLRAQAGSLLDDNLVCQALQEAESLLLRFQRHPLYNEINTALERYHELPYINPTRQNPVLWGYMDCLYRTPAGWTLVDFKTDELNSSQALQAAVEKYRPQLLRYRQAAADLLGSPPRALLCFLNASKTVEIHDMI